MPRPLLIISNGHGEDAIGALLVPELRRRGFVPEAMPIVGEGGSYRRLGVPIVGPTQAMPSGGFIYGRPVAFAGDVANGLVGLTLGQIKAMRQERERFGLVLAIGDIVPLAFAWLSRADFAFVGCAKSDYYLQGKPGSYFWHERALLRHPRCKAVFPRDAVTGENLERARIRATYLGNPMMDGLAPSGIALPGPEGVTTVLLLPGSREEAYRNMRVLARSARAIARAGRPLRLLAAIAPGLRPEGFCHDDWALDGLTLRAPEAPAIHLLPGGFADAAHAADLAIGMAGTANEQVAGLGKPVIIIPGAGPQFTASFAEAQTRLLGESVLLLPDEPERVAAAFWELLADGERLARIAANGTTRMGEPGAAGRIAEAIAAL